MCKLMEDLKTPRSMFLLNVLNTWCASVWPRYLRFFVVDVYVVPDFQRSWFSPCIDKNLSKLHKKNAKYHHQW